VKRAWPYLAFLLLATLLYTVYRFDCSKHGWPESDAAQGFWRFNYAFLIAWWTGADRRQLNQKFAAPFEFEAFVFFAWPIAFPYYLYKTRRGIGLVLFVGFLILLTIPNLAAAVARLLG